MRIAQVAPLYESVPPRCYGGTERVVAYLTDALVEMGHEVTLYASGDSETRARLVPACPQGLWRDTSVRNTLAHHVTLMGLVFRDASRYDVLHFHCDHLHLPMLRHEARANLTTLHGQIHVPDLAPLLAQYPDAPLVSISNDQRRPLPDANWLGTVYHGLPRDLHAFHPKRGDYLAFLGRCSPEKRADRAIEIALRAGIPLKIAARVRPEEREFFESCVQPLIRKAGRMVEFLGEIAGPDQDEFLGNARALLFPIDWPEPFGLVIIEALACGTPVIGWRCGSVPELIEDGVTGFIVDGMEQAVRAVHSLDRIDRARCRRAFENRFDAARMGRDYADLYARIASRRTLANPRSRMASRNGWHSGVPAARQRP